MNRKFNSVKLTKEYINTLCKNLNITQIEAIEYMTILEENGFIYLHKDGILELKGVN